MDRNGGCCIARWTDEGHVASNYDKSKMDMIMLKFRPIAPKPVSQTGTPAATSDCSNNSPRDGPHAKGTTRGRRKNNNNNCKTKVNNKSSNNGRKRKSNSPENRTAEIIHHDYDDQDRTVGGGGGVTLLPLFPEAPDLSPIKQQEDNSINIPMMWLNFNDGYNTNNYNTPVFENNYRNCHGYGR